MPNPDDLLMDRYRILERIGSGGMATVHRARDERLDRDVAVKILLPNLADDPATAARFEREARSLAASSHPGVVAVFDVDAGDAATGREPFFVMELCRGGSLAERLAGGRRMSPDDLIPILASVADGLADLHRRGIVHRDLKPQNILFGDDRPKLADFGLALSSDGGGPSDLTTPGTAVGTLAYLAPEVLAGQRATAASDVYALGVVAFTGLTGRLPRPATSLAELVAASGSPAPLVSSVAPDLGRAFDAPIGAALGLAPDQRPDALSFASGLASALGQWTRAGGPSRHGATEVAAASSPTADDALLVAIARSPAWDPAAVESETSMTATSVRSVADDATTVIPVDATGVHRASREPAPRGRRAGTSRPGRAAIVAALILTPAIAVLGLVGSALRSGPGTTSGGPSAPAGSVAASVAPPASASPAASPSTAAPSPSADPAVAALNAVHAAISSAKGGPDGLKGKEANDLEKRVGDVRRALDAGDRRAALAAARELDKRIRDLHNGGDDLRQASADLVRALGG